MPNDSLLDLPDDPREASRALYEKGYTDGLPVIPPTPARVAEMLAADSRPPATVLGRLPPRLGAATLEAVAINAVMAGAMPEHFCVITAALEALLDAQFNLLGVQATTHPCAPVVVVSGPVRHGLKMNLGANAMGEGNLASATIGRALRLVLRNVGGAIPGTTDMVTHGSPARLGFTFAENAEDSPFPPFHTTLGFAASDSVVSTFAGEGPHNVNDHSSHSARGVLLMIAGTMATSGTNDLARGGKPLVVLGPEHAEIVGREKMSRQDVQQFLFEHARFPRERLPQEMTAWLEGRTDINRDLWNARGVPVADRPEDIYVLCAGGRGRHSVYIPNFAFSRPTWRKVQFDQAVAPGKPVCDC